MPGTRRIFLRCALGAPLLAATAPGHTLGQRSLYFTVEDGDKLVTGLKESNFRLYEDGQPVSFRLAEPESPIAVTFLVEYSQASGLYLNDIITAFRELWDAGARRQLVCAGDLFSGAANSPGFHPTERGNPLGF